MACGDVMRINTRDRDPRPAVKPPPGPRWRVIEKINGPGGMDRNDCVETREVHDDNSIANDAIPRQAYHNEDSMNNATQTQKAIAVTMDDDAMSPTLTLTFANGQALTISPSMLTADIVVQATMHGLKQKLVDAAAISRNPDTGRSATIDDKYAAVREVYDRLLMGQWNKGRADGTTGTGGYLFRALCILYATKTPDAIREFLSKKSKVEQAALRATPKIKTIIDDLKLADARNGDDVGLDTDAMLDELN